MTSYAIEDRLLEAQATAVMTASLPTEEIGPFLSAAFGTVAAYLAEHARKPAGMPFARYRRLGEARFAVEAGFPVASPVSGDGSVHPSLLPGGRAAATWHVGPYEEVGPAYEALAGWIAAHGATSDGDPWEIYDSDPATEPDQRRWRTEIFQPYRPR